MTNRWAIFENIFQRLLLYFSLQSIRSVFIHGTKYPKMDQVKFVEGSLQFFKGCLSQFLLGPFLNTLLHMSCKVFSVDIVRKNFQYIIAQTFTLSSWCTLSCLEYLSLDYLDTLFNPLIPDNACQLSQFFTSHFGVSKAPYRGPEVLILTE